MPRRYKRYRAKAGSEVYKRLDKDAVRSADNLPQHRILRQGADHSSIPSKKLPPPTPDEGARDTIMERVRQRKINGAEGKEIERKAKCLAPAYNKGAYQYVGTEQDAADAGHKGAGDGER